MLFSLFTEAHAMCHVLSAVSVASVRRGRNDREQEKGGTMSAPQASVFIIFRLTPQDATLPYSAYWLWESGHHL